MNFFKKNVSKQIVSEITASVTCKLCSSISQVTPNDLTELRNVRPPKFEGNDYKFYCPCCKQITFVANPNVLTFDFIKKILKVVPLYL